MQPCGLRPFRPLYACPLPPLESWSGGARSNPESASGICGLASARLIHFPIFSAFAHGSPSEALHVARPICYAPLQIATPLPLPRLSDADLDDVIDVTAEVLGGWPAWLKHSKGVASGPGPDLLLRVGGRVMASQESNFSIRSFSFLRAARRRSAGPYRAAIWSVFDWTPSQCNFAPSPGNGTPQPLFGVHICHEENGQHFS